MAGKSQSEKAKLERRIRIEKTVLPTVCVFGIAVFIILAAVFGKKSGLSSAKTTPIPTAGPTERPYITIAKKAAGETNGEYIEGSDFAAVTFVSPLDGSSVKADYYLKSGLNCVRIVRAFSVMKDAPKEDPDDDPFSDEETEETPVPVFDTNRLESLADELISCIGRAYMPNETASVKRDTVSALSVIYEKTANKSEIVFGVYLVKFSYSAVDSLLTVICEPT